MVLEIAHLLHSRGLDFEVCGDVASKHTGFKRFNVTANVCLRSKEMAIIHVVMSFFVSIRHDDATTIGFNLRNWLNTLLIGTTEKLYHEQGFA